MNDIKKTVLSKFVVQTPTLETNEINTNSLTLAGQSLEEFIEQNMGGAEAIEQLQSKVGTLETSVGEINGEIEEISSKSYAYTDSDNTFTQKNTFSDIVATSVESSSVTSETSETKTLTLVNEENEENNLQITSDTITTPELNFNCDTITINNGVLAFSGSSDDASPDVITVDLVFDGTSTNPQSGIAIQDAIQTSITSAFTTNGISVYSGGKMGVGSMSVYMGYNMKNYTERGVTIGCGASGYYGATTIGLNAQCGNYYSCAYGIDSKAGGMGSIAIGSSAQTTTNLSTAIGMGTVVKDSGVTAIGCNTQISWTNQGDNNIQTILYLIGATTALANKYEDGAACLGYVVKKKDGTILECGTKKLSELLTNNTAFAPTSMGLDDEPTPTPFLPTGITDPIIFPEKPLNL